MIPDTEVDDADELEAEAEVEGDDLSDSDADDGDADETEAGDGEAGDAEDEADGGAAPEIKTKKGNPEFGRLRREARENRERAERAERDLAETRSRDTGRTSEEQRRQEQERISLMSADEKIEHYRQQDRQEFGRELAQIKFENADARDATAFESKCSRTPALAAVADEVEKLLKSERAQGRYGASRETLAKYIIGDRALKNAGRAKGKQAKRAGENKERQTSRAGSGRSDVASGGDRRGDSAEARRKRLESVVF